MQYYSVPPLKKLVSKISCLEEILFQESYFNTILFSAENPQLIIGAKSNFPALRKLQCSSRVKKEKFPHLEEASVAALLYHRMEPMPRWHGCANAGKLDRTGPLKT